MKNVKKIASNLIIRYKLFDFMHLCFLILFRRKKITFLKYPKFSGWGMNSASNTPWDKALHSGLASDFKKSDQKLRENVARGVFVLTQFKNMFPYKSDRVLLDELMYRHYTVFWSAQLAIRNTSVTNPKLVECGVCDGLTAFFAMEAVKSICDHSYFSLFDAWASMKGELLLESEQKYVGEYGWLSLEQTKLNLDAMGCQNIEFIKGYIPETLRSKTDYGNLCWLHIDLNSAEATIATLDHFWEILVPGAVILFDDYALPGYEATKSAVDNWIIGLEATFLQLPTGQALIIKTIK